VTSVTSRRKRARIFGATADQGQRPEFLRASNGDARPAAVPEQPVHPAGEPEAAGTERDVVPAHSAAVAEPVAPAQTAAGQDQLQALLGWEPLTHANVRPQNSGIGAIVFPETGISGA
jgi:hypothetical protein